MSKTTPEEAARLSNKYSLFLLPHQHDGLERLAALIDAVRGVNASGNPPAPSQPAAPVELPVVAKVFQKPRILEAHIPIIEPLVPWDQLPFHTELVKLSDAQAAIAAGRKAS